ncbi:MAG: cyclopropane fatty acyl phospholipid synthase [Nitrospirota bacterium]
MGADGARALIEEILSSAGIGINGASPHDLRIRDDRFFERILRDGSIGLGEAYMDGWWECACLDELFCRLMPLEPELRLRKSLKLATHLLKAAVLNVGSRSRAYAVGKKHYDRGNELYRYMLDRRMIYSCAYWKNAQEAKLDLICRKLRLKPGDRVLDIGCGWGGFAQYAAERYGTRVTGITISREQVALGRKRCSGLPVEIRLQDYRDLRERFDHIVSVGMFEHVGHKNYRTYMETVHRCLEDRGLFLLHTIGSNVSNIATDPWIDKYIFPNSLIPSMRQISAAAERLFVVEDWHNFGHDYDPTLMAWFRNFDRHWEKLRAWYDDRFYRMWKFYLLSCAGAFRSRYLQVWQLVFSKNGLSGGYEPVR